MDDCLLAQLVRALQKAGDEENMASDPDLSAIPPHMWLFNLELLSSSLEKFPQKRPAGFIIILLNRVQKWESSSLSQIM